ncbi:MAG: pectate lyase family protein [Bacteroidota bacterium]
MKKIFLNRTVLSIWVIGLLIGGCELQDIDTITDPEVSTEETEEEEDNEEETEEEQQEEAAEDTTETSGEYKVPEFEETKAFPTAQGYGRYTKGGRDGQTVYVTSLEDSRNKGTLRYALEEVSGPRTVVFRVGGIIELSDNLKIEEPYITIAGQTAPGSGITLKNAGIRIETHDIIIRHLRIRPGDNINTGTDPTSRDALTLYKNRNCHNIMLDHISFTWSIDENVAFSTGSNNLTIQKSIIAEGLSNSYHEEGEHSKGLLMLNDLDNISIVNNLFAHNMGRNPLISSNSRNIHVLNNLVYNWGPMSPGFGTHTQIFRDEIPITDAMIYRNYYRKGATSHDLPVLRKWGFLLVDGSTLFVEDNYIDDGGDLNPIEEVSPSYLKEPEYFEEYLINNPPDNWDRYYDQIRGINEVDDYVLNNAGARMPILDEVDERIIEETSTYSGDFVDSPSDRGGYPTQRAGEAPEDSDRDGIPDKWEVEKGLNPESAEDASENTLSPYYTNLEIYLNELAGDYEM